MKATVKFASANLLHLASCLLVQALTDWESTEAVSVNLLHIASAHSACKGQFAVGPDRPETEST